MARKKHGDSSITNVTQEEFDSEGYYNGYSIFAGRALLHLLEHGRAVFDRINKRTPPERRVLFGWQQALDTIKKEYPADYLYLMEKAKNRDNIYLSNSVRTYLSRLIYGQKKMLQISTPSKTFRCANATVAVYWINKNFGDDIQWFTIWDTPLIRPNRYSILDRIKRYGIAEYRYTGGWLKITRVKNSEKAGKEGRICSEVELYYLSG